MGFTMKLALLSTATLSALTLSVSAFAADPVTVNGGTVHFTGENRKCSMCCKYRIFKSNC